MSNAQAIGLFDSGVGGLSVWREVVRLLPHESTVYYADSANCPYGPRPDEELKALSDTATRFLLARDCKLIVVACNTASAAALEYLRAEFEVPFVGMEPALKPAAEATKTGSIGVLATEGTLNGELFRNTAQRHASDLDIHIQVGTGLVEQVEAGLLTDPETERLLRQYLEPLLAANVDQIALGCTHYPLLLPLIETIVAGRAQVVDPAPAIARQVQRLLSGKGLEAETAHVADHQFYTTGKAAALKKLASGMAGRPVGVTEVPA